MLLALNPEWQARARAEVSEVCGGQLPDADMLRRMKVVCIIKSSFRKNIRWGPHIRTCNMFLYQLCILEVTPHLNFKTMRETALSNPDESRGKFSHTTIYNR